MIKPSDKHVWYYGGLSIVLFLGLVLTVLSRQNPTLRMLAVLLTAFFYVTLGIVHHVLHHDTSVRIVIEYTLVGALGITLALLTIH